MGYRQPRLDRVLDAVADLARARWDRDRASVIESFIRAYYAGAAPEDLEERRAEDLYGAALRHWHLGYRREPGASPLIRVYNPDPERHGWESTHTVVEIVADDSPFLIDSVSIALNRAGRTIHLVVHPVLAVERDEQGQWVDLGADTHDHHEAYMRFEIDRCTDPEWLRALHERVASVLDDVRRVVADWRPMRRKMVSAAAALRRQPPRGGVSGEELTEVLDFLRWATKDHFTFLGYRCYDLKRRNGETVLKPVAKSGLGLVRGAPVECSTSFSALPPEVREKAGEPYPLILTKASTRSTVHLPTYISYIGVKRFNKRGEVVGEHRFLGLYTSAAYNRRPLEIPILRRKIEYVIQQAGLLPNSHAGKALLNILETYPRGELFEIDSTELHRIAMGILHLHERQRVRLFVRYDVWQRFVSCLVYVPRERYDTTVRRRMQAILEEACGGGESDYSIHLWESVLARIQFVVRLPEPGVPELDIPELERQLVATLRSWSDDLHDALLEYFGEERGNQLFERYREAFSAAYREEMDARTAAHDVERIEAVALGGEGPIMGLYRPLEAVDGLIRFKVFHGERPATLSDALPVLENMGMRVIDERPFEVTPADCPVCWLHDFGLTWEGGGSLDVEEVAERFQDAFAAVWCRQAEDDGFNRLVLAAALPWREVVLLRAYSRYLRQAGTTFSQDYIEETLAAYPEISAKLVALFHARFHPDAYDSQRAQAIAGEIRDAMRHVESLDQDRILRRFHAAVRATVRTNYYSAGEGGAVVFKLNPSVIPELPRPHPWAEAFVYSPDVEGVHLRGGEVARGGIRWSDRREDFRTEVLGLMKAQMVKNAVIVPLGAKGGFVVKRLPPDRADQQEKVRRCYRAYVGALLEITDNLVDGEIRPPERVVRHDDSDTYLVVAADKGTATFSDLANEVAEERGFWLRDAFASGGSAGYDHKKMGITARGAWEAVKRHFRELGKDIQQEPFTVVGIGDMSGDVFGNGMLLSRRIRLVAAFDHRHIFIDPDPDPETAYSERRRLFEKERSSWDDYDRSLISEGGGVYPRSAKSVTLSERGRSVLGITAEQLTPDELIRGMLRAPVDLLWNGGIGTYVKADEESHAEVGDKSADGVRINASQLRCRVVGEGGNLGSTQRGRVRFALNGGKINTDFIDNAGGVDCSDHEVNIKILLNDLVSEGELTWKHRNQLLEEMTGEVAELVLADCYRQTQSLTLSEAVSTVTLDEQAAFIRRLEREGLLDRSLEFLPDDEALGERAASGRGLMRPELALLHSYAKIVVQRTLMASGLSGERFVETVLFDYFPRPIVERYPERVTDHRLRVALAATQVANHVVNRMGPTFYHRLSEKTGADFAAVTRAWCCADRIFRIDGYWGAVDALDNRIDAALQTEMLLRLCGLHKHATVWMLDNMGLAEEAASDVEGAVERICPLVDRLSRALLEVVPAGDRAAMEAEASRLREAGVPAELSLRVATADALRPALDVVRVAEEAGTELIATATCYYRLLDALDLTFVRDLIRNFKPADGWQARLRSGVEADFYLQLREATGQYVTAYGADSGRVERFVTERQAAVERLRNVLSELRGGGAVSASMLAVTVQEVKALVRVGAGRDALVAP